MNRLIPLGLALLTVGAIGCKNNASGYVAKPAVTAEPLNFDPNQGSTLMPLTPGNQWTYTVTLQRSVNGQLESDQPQQAIYRVVSVQQTGQGTKAVIELTVANQLQDRQGWLLTKEGLFQTSGGPTSISYAPAQPVIKFPVKPFSTFSWAGTGETPLGAVGHFSISSKVLPVETVDTAMGPFQAVPIKTVSNLGSGTSTSTTWFRPGRGMIRYRQHVVLRDPKSKAVVESVVTLELQNFALKQS